MSAPVRKLDDGSSVVNLSIATTDKWKDKDTGELRERTEWCQCLVAWPRQS
ncbi:MAG: single-stranded DNA-binding protein [Alphaproteobacteria bacterium]|nr:single-stranded DNA-binding protein [Alphaproteobacteria bacterium]